MVTTQTKKKQLAFRASKEICDRINLLTTGENPPFESVSEYLYHLVVSDLARRDMGPDDIQSRLLLLLNDRDFVERVKERLK